MASIFAISPFRYFTILLFDMRFYAVDVETANSDQGSICQIGVGVFEDGLLIDAWKTYVDPEAYFHWQNVRVHGISREDVEEAPTFPEVYDDLRLMFENNIVVHHSPFDRTAFRKAFERYSLEPYEVKWLDSVKVARRAFGNGCLEGGYNLANLAAYLDIDFQHHDALEDAIAAGKIVVYAMQRCGMGVEEFLR